MFRRVRMPCTKAQYGDLNGRPSTERPDAARSAYQCPPWCVMSLEEHEQNSDGEPWHAGAPVTIGDHEVTLMALVDSTGLVDAGVLDAQGNYLTATVLRPYIATLQGMLGKLDALTDASG